MSAFYVGNSWRHFMSAKFKPAKTKKLTPALTLTLVFVFFIFFESSQLIGLAILNPHSKWDLLKD
jgi:hypothetical protein